MRKAGAGFGDALFAALRGNMMTEEQAALCVQAYWRRYLSVIYYQESRGAAITMQASFRGLKERRDIRQKTDAAAMLQARMRGNFTREVTDYELVEFRAATQLQSVWRRHLACGVVSKIRWERQSRLKRTFSWGKKAKKAGKPSARSTAIPMSPRNATNNNPTAGKPVKRASSFDRFSRGTKSSAGGASKDAAAAAAPQQTFSKQLLFILLSRGPNGLGLELDATNTVINVVKGGAADVQGYFRVGDTIASVDGIPLRGRLLQEVMDPGKSSYSFDVWRLTMPAPAPAPAEPKGVRRALSFDRKTRR